MCGCVFEYSPPLSCSHFGSFMSVLDILLCSLSTFIHIDNKICLVGPSPTQTAFHANLISSKALRCPCRCRLLWLQGMGIEVCVGGGGMGSLFVLTVFISSFQLVFFLFRLKCIYFFPRSFLPANRKSCICICLGISHNNNIETDLRLCKPNRVEPSSVPDSIRKLQCVSLCATTVRICMELSEQSMALHSGNYGEPLNWQYEQKPGHEFGYVLKFPDEEKTTIRAHTQTLSLHRDTESAALEYGCPGFDLLPKSHSHNHPPSHIYLCILSRVRLKCERMCVHEFMLNGWTRFRNN